jgi:membrane protein DedA with SNARE-associated domain
MQILTGDYADFMDINGLIEQYGYAALVIGSVAEGETITLLGGVARIRGY